MFWPKGHMAVLTRCWDPMKRLWVLPCLDCPTEHHAGNQLPWLRLGQSVQWTKKSATPAKLRFPPVLGHNRGGSKDYSMHIIECSNFIQFEHWLNQWGRIAGLPGCRVAGVPGCQVAGLPGCRVAGLPGCRGAGVPGCRGAGVPGCRGAGLPGCRAARKMKTERKGKVRKRIRKRKRKGKEKERKRQGKGKGKEKARKRKGKGKEKYGIGKWKGKRKGHEKE